MEKPVIAITEDEENSFQDSIQRLALQGVEVIKADGLATLIQIVRTRSLNLIILCSSLKSDWDIIQAAREVREWNRDVPLILIVAKSTEELAIAAIRAGVSDYLKKPVSRDDLVACVNKCLSYKPCLAPGSGKITSEFSLIGSEKLIGESPAMRLIKTYISRVATTDSTVLITGETGTGKEVVADLVHRNSVRNKKPFICVNCAALPDSLLESELFGYERGAFTGALGMQRGKFELADNGTIFLDEIGDMSLHAQAKILRIIENREIYRLGGNRGIPLSLRIVAATNHDPESLVKKRQFREDLYYRLNVARIHLPPLRERKQDITFLLNHFIQHMNRQSGRSVGGFTDEALAYLLRYKWPGNVRELKNLCEAIFISQSSQSITIKDLPSLSQNCLSELESLPLSEREQLLSALFATNWNVSKVAEKLQWSRMTVYRKLEKYHIKRDDGLEDEKRLSKTAQVASPAPM